MNEMKLMVLEALQNIPDGLTLEYEAVENRITICMEYVERERFNTLNICMDQLIKKFNDRNYVITYDNTVNKRFGGVLKHYRYVCMKQKENN